MNELPLYYNFAPGWWAVHAGCQPGVPVAEQEPNALMRCRVIDADGKVVNGTVDHENPPDGTCFWAEVWDQDQNIVFGHVVFDAPRTYFRRAMAMGIDTGCCFGGSLTAAIFKNDRFERYVSVNAKREYYPRRLNTNE